MGRARRGVRLHHVALVALLTAALIRFQPLRRSPGHQRTRGPSTSLLAPLVAVWLAGGIVDSIASAIGWATSPVYDAVRRLVDGVVGWVSDWVGHVVDWAERAFDGVWGVVNSLGHWAATVGDWIGAEWTRISGWIGAAVGRATDWVTGRLGDLTNWARAELDHLYGYAKQIVDDAYTWVTDNVWRPLSDLVNGAVSWVTDTILPWVSAQIEGVSSWARSMFDWVLQHAEDLIRQALDALTPAWQLVEACWGWLTFIARNPIDWVVRLWHDLVDTAPDEVERMIARAFDDNSGAVEEAVSRWFT